MLQIGVKYDEETTTYGGAGEKMTLYEAIFARRSVRSFRKDKIEDQILEGMAAFFREMEPLFPGIETSIEIIEKGKSAGGRFSGFRNVRAPYYLAIYAEEKEKAQMNAGYIMQQLALYLFSKGIGSCFQGMAHVKTDAAQSGLSFVMLMAFGYPKTEAAAKNSEIRRLPMEELCAYKEKPKKYVETLLEAARTAPSAMNSQPWRFVAYENRIHIFSKRAPAMARGRDKFNEFHFGVMLANVMVAAEQLWVETDLIRLDNITHIELPNNQYVFSLLIRE